MFISRGDVLWWIGHYTLTELFILWHYTWTELFILPVWLGYLGGFRFYFVCIGSAWFNPPLCNAAQLRTQWGWYWIGHLFYVTSTFVHHFVAIGEFKLKLQSGKCSIWVKIEIFRDGLLWNLMDKLENNRTHLLCYVKLCTSFRSHRWIQTGVTVRKLLIRMKIGNVLSLVTWKFDGWFWKTTGYLSYAT